jgi:hypothetical protein
LEGKEINDKTSSASRCEGEVVFGTERRHSEERGDEAIQLLSLWLQKSWIASRSPSSGAHSRDPVARNDGFGCLTIESYLRRPCESRDHSVSAIALVAAPPLGETSV